MLSELIYVSLVTVIISLVMAFIAPKTLKRLRPDGEQINADGVTTDPKALPG